MFDGKTVAIKGDGTKGDPGCNPSSQEFLSAASWYEIHTLSRTAHIGQRHECPRKMGGVCPF